MKRATALSPGEKKWPAEPYKGLAYYGASDRLLFSGRDADVDGCVRRISSPETRILLIHGRTGCGKSSFLRAGLIPELEEQGPSFLFLPNADGTPAFVRCGSDPLGRIAEQLFRFASDGITLDGIREQIHYDLSPALLGLEDLASFVDSCRRHGKLKECLHIISTILPCTLVIIIDQAEEVITLADSTKPHRRQFFHFIKEFSSVNFPVKLVMALRKDYSGQFVELAQMGGGVDLRERDRTDREGSPSQDLAIKSDVKLFLLAELSADQVTLAITLPTEGCDLPAQEQAGTAFSAYRFEFAPKVVGRIVEDLFAKSSTAVLPVMQVVCRELYKKVAPKSDSPPATIVMDDYVTGGDISGPVDRHISNSLRGIFDLALEADEVRTEEDRWREVLFKFVRLESDGTAHTRFVDEEEFRAFARERNVLTDVDTVIDHLAQPDVLLLRRVPSDTNAGGVPSLSLGHDFLAMVLNVWKVTRQAEEFAQAKALRVRMRVAKYATGALAVTVILVGLVYHFARIGGEEQAYRVLLNMASDEQWTRPIVAMTVSAYATKVADDIERSSAFLMHRDTGADQMLATLLARLPTEDLITQPTDKAPTPISAFVHSVFPLPMSKGFMEIQGDRVRVTAAGWKKPFDLAPFEGSNSSIHQLLAFIDQPSVAVSEVDQDKLLLLRTSARDSAIFQLYVLKRNGDKLGPFGAESFQERVPWLWRGQSGSNLDVEQSQVILSGPLLVFQTSKAKPKSVDRRFYRLRSFVFNPATRNGAPLRSALSLDGIELDTTGQASGGILSPVFVDRFLILPEATNRGETGIDGLFKYDLSMQSSTRSPLRTSAAKGGCPPNCVWRWRPIGSDRTTIAFVALNREGLMNERFQYSFGSQGLDGTDALLVIEVGSDRESIVSKADIDAARKRCLHDSKDNSDPDMPATAAFVTRWAEGPLLGLVRGQSLDLLQIKRGTAPTAEVQCASSLAFLNPLDAWVAASDKALLLGTGPNSTATWNLSESVDTRKLSLLKQGHLRDLACKAGIESKVVNVAKLAHLDPKDAPATICPAAAKASS